MPRWYYKLGKKHVGPIDNETFRLWMKNGQMLPDQLVRTEEMTDWLRVQDLSPTGEIPTSAPTNSRPSDSPPMPSSLRKAAQNGDLAKVKALIKDNPNLILSKDNKDRTPLLLAVWNGQRDVAQWLLANKADVNDGGKNGWTPLHSAVSGCRKDIVELLLSHGAEVNARNSRGATPLHVAATNGHKGMAEMLLAHGADVNAKDENGHTPVRIWKLVARINYECVALCALLGIALIVSAGMCCFGPKGQFDADMNTVHGVLFVASVLIAAGYGAGIAFGIIRLKDQIPEEVVQARPELTRFSWPRFLLEGIYSVGLALVLLTACAVGLWCRLHRIYPGNIQ